MINGYEYLYQAENDKKPKYKLCSVKDGEHFAHNIDGSGKTSHLGVTSCEAYTNLIEQNVGKNIYDKLFKLYANYDDLYKTTKSYQQDKIEIDRLSVKLSKAKTNLNNIENNKARIQSSINKIMKSKDVHKAERLQTLAEELKEIESDVDLFENEFKLVEEDYKKIESLVNTEYLKINELKNQLQKEIENFDAKKIEELKNKFNDRNFQMQIEQEFVDTLLLPNEHAKEGGVRYMAQTYFKAFKNEMKYLSTLKSGIQNLINDINKQYSEKIKKDIYIADKVSAEYQIVKGIKNLTTDVIENAQARFDSKTFCEFYNETMQMVKDSEYGKNPSTEMYNLPELAMKKYKFKTNKVKNPGQDLDSSKDIFDGVANLIDGKIILTSEENKKL